MRKTSVIGANVKKFLIFAVIAALLLISTIVFGTVTNGFGQTVNVAEAADTRGANATAGLTGFSGAYSSKTITLSVGTPTASNISWTAYSKDGQQYSLDLDSGKFGVKKSGNYGSFNSYVAALNVEVPNWLRELASSTSLSVTLTGDYYCWRHANLLDDGEFYFGVKQSSSLLSKPIDLGNSSVRDNLDEDKASSFLPGYEHTQNVNIGLGTSAASKTGTYTAEFVLSSDTKYIGIGISGHGDAYPGYATPEGYLQNIKLSFQYDGGTTNATNTNITIKNDNYGSCTYTYYPNATLSSVGTPNATLTLAKGKSITLSTSNPFAFVLITPIESVANHRFTNVSVNNKTYTLDYDSSNDDAPNQFLVYTLTNTTLTATRKTAYAGSYTYAKGSSSTILNFDAFRQYKVVYRANGGTGADTTLTYDCDSVYSVPSPIDDFNFSKTGSVPSGWTYTTDNHTDTTNSNRGKQYYSGNTFSNLFPNLKNNTTIIYFDTVWVDASANNAEKDIITKMEMSAYTDKYSDVEFTITASKTGHTLTQVYATYTSGDISGQKIALEQTQAPDSSNVSKWVLYGISGNCDITTEWRANTYSITYSYDTNKGTISTTSPSSYVYGMGVKAYNLPYVTAEDGYIWQGWSTSSSGNAIYNNTTVLNNTTGDQTLYAIFTNHSRKMHITSTSDVSTATNITDGLANGSYVKHGDQQISNSSVTLNMRTPKTVLSSSQLGWAYQNVDKNASNYAHYYIALGGSAEKYIRSGYSAKIEITATYAVGAFVGRGASEDATAQVGLGVYAGISDSNTTIATWGSLVKGSTNQGSLGVGGIIGAKDSKWTESTGTVTDSVTISPSTAVPVVRINLGGKFVCVKPAAVGGSEYACYGYFTEITYKITWTKPAAKSITINANGATALTGTNLTLGLYNSSDQTFTLPSNPFTRTGYEFVGWGTTSSASSVIAPGTSVSVSSATTYYAIWRKKKYPVNTYDVWTDGTNYVATIRKQYFVEYKNTLYFYPTNTTNTSYINSTSSSSLYPYAGGGDYNGFTAQSQAYRIPDHNFKTHQYVYDSGNSTPITSSLNSSIITGAVWGYYVWELNDLTATTDDATVDYGTSVDMDDLVHPTHDATEKEFSWLWSTMTGDSVVFYKNHELFLADESGNYTVSVTVSVVRGGVTLSKSIDVVRPSTVTINQLRLKIDASGDRTFKYNGENHEFPLRTLLDEEYYVNLGYTDEQIAYLVSIFEMERNENLGRRPWYYDEEMKQENELLGTAKRDLEKWRYGVAVNLMGLGYSSYIAGDGQEDFYEGTTIGGVRQFKDAGTYWASLLHILKATGDTVSRTQFNTNYVWSADENGGQIFTASQAGAENTVYAQIQPEDGFYIYALYVQKTFGKIADPTPVPFTYSPENDKFNIEALEQYWEQLDQGKFSETWILAIDGLLDSDFNLYGELIASKLKRDTSAALHQKAGIYDVYLDTSLTDGTIRNEFLALLNNYGVKLDSATSTVARDGFGTVKMRWVNQDGSIKDGEFDFTAPLSSYSGERNNFEIIAKDIQLTYDGANSYTYNGSPQGPSNIISSGYLSEEEKAAFKNQFGDDYGQLFKIYFYGIPLSYSLDWNGMSAEQQTQYIKDNKASANIIGYEGLNYITGVDDKYAISLYEINAGSYAVVIIGAAYKDGNGDFHENVSFNLSSPLYLNWEIKQKSIEVEVQHTSMIFGDANYGGARYTLSQIVGSDKVKIKNLTISYDQKSAAGFLRYSTLTADTLIANGDTLSVYGTFVGNYNVTMDGIISVDMSQATGLYGIASESYGSADTNYKLTSDDDFTITPRSLKTGETEYTADGGATFSTEIPDLTYVYGVKKGIKIVLSDFYAANFLTADVTAVAQTDDNVLILASDIVDTSRMMLIRTHENSECTVTVDPITDAVTYVFTAINAATYRVSLSRFTYTYEGKTYGNYDLTEKNVNYTIKPKTVTVKWFLDEKEVVGTDVPSVVYDGNPHSVSAQFVRAESGILSTTDNLVYFGDYVNETQIYSVYQNQNILSLEFSAEGNDSYTDVNVVDDIDTPYNTFLKLFSTGNYRFAESGEGSYSISWEITRREFTISVSNLGNAFIYDGNSHQAILNFESGDVPVVLSGFNAITSSGAKFEFSEGLIFNASNNSLSATDSGIYEFSYDAESKIKIDKNWLLTGKADYVGDNFLFAIVPRVLSLNFNTTLATYNSANLISRFRASYIDSEVPLPDGDTVFTYNLSEIIHAGTYDITVTGATSASGNFVLAEANPTGWYATIADGLKEYYSNQTIIDAYTATVTVNPHTVTLDPVAIDAGLIDYVYDGLEHGYTMEYLYDNFVKSMLYEADKEGYSLKGTSEVGKNVGTYHVTIEGFNPFNGYTDYRLTREEGYSDTWSITRRILEFVYTEFHSGGNAYVYDGNNHGYTLVVNNIVDGESIQLQFNGTNVNIASPLTIGSVNSTDIYGSAATSYSISGFTLANATVDGVTYLSSNYRLPEGGVAKSWTIEQKVITVEWHNTELTYRASEYAPDNGGVYATVTNSVEGDVFTLNYGNQKSATNAGTYTISIEDLTGGDYANYTIEGTLSTTWKINPKNVTAFTWNGVGDGFTNTPTLAVTYNGAYHNIVATPAAGAKNADDGKIYDADAANFTFTYSSADGHVISALVAGDYKTAISGCNSINYTVPDDANAEMEWKILKRELTVTYTYNYGTEITYCAATRGVVLTIGGFIASDFGANLDFAVTTDVSADNGGSASGTVYTRTLRSVNVGNYTASVKIDETALRASCYELSGTLDAAFKIVPLTAILEWNLCDLAHTNKTAEYDGQPHELKATVTNLASSSDVVNVTVSGGIQTNQGTYTGIATSLDNANYALPESESARSSEFTISPRTINAIWTATAESYTYNGKYISDSLTLSRLIASDAVSFKIEFYKSVNGVLSLFATATVSKSGLAEYDLTASDFKKTIDAASYVAIFDGKVYNADGSVNDNYTYNSTGDERTEFTINRATLKLSDGWTYSNNGKVTNYDSSAILIYNAKPYTLTKEIDADSLFVRDDTQAKDEVSLVYTGNVNTNVGTGAYTATISSLSGTYASNYRLPSQGVSVSYAINPKGVTLVWENYSDIIYDGQTHTVTATVKFGATNDTDGLAYDGDIVEVSQYQNNAYRNADSYTASALGLDNENYFIENNSSLEWAIAPRPVELTWSFDTVQYDGTLKTVTATVDNRVAGDTITLTYENNQYISKGTYTASVSALSNTNYTLTDGKNLSHEWEITPIVLAFSWSSASGLVYNGSAQGITLIISNIADADFENADKLSFTAQTTPDGSQTATENRTAKPIRISFTATNAGTYTVTIIGLDGESKDNYVLPDNADATYVIAPKVIDIDWTTDTFVYSKQNHEVTAKVINAEDSDVVTLTYSTKGSGYSVSGLATVGNVAMHAGSYSTTVTAVDNSNYTVTGASNLNCDWTISPKSITDVTYRLDENESLTAIYDRTAHVLTATANGAATSDDDGRIYDGDSVGFVYAGAITENYGLSAINRNSAVEAGKYKVSITATDNSDYTASSLSCEFTVSRRVLTLSKEDVTTTAFVYDGKSQGVNITVSNLLEYDNNSTRFSLDAVISPSGTAESAVRSGASYTKRFLAVNAGEYTLTFSLSGSAAQNYELEPFECGFTIIRKTITTQISADITADNIVYRAESIDASDLSVTFNDLITGERLILGDDFTVTFTKGGVALDNPPINVGAYTAKISLKADGQSSINYELIGNAEDGTAEFPFEIKPYEINPNMLDWTLNGNSIKLNSLTFKDGENKTVTISSVNDDIFNKIAGKNFSYVYFGLCNCGLDAKSPADLDEEHLAHQWLTDGDNFRTVGPEHAGSYFVVLTLSGGDADNFVLTDFDNYSGNYFYADGDDTYLVYNRSTDKFIETPLPVLGDGVAALRFGIGRLHQGVVVDAKSSLPFKGTAYTVGQGLPEVTAADTSNIRVEIGSGTYTYEEYSSAAFGAIKNAGEYSIKIYDNTAIGGSGSVSGCDLFNSDAEMEVVLTLTVEKAKITVTDASAPYWSKVYDGTTSYSDFAFNRNVTFASTTDGDGNVIATSDGVLVGTSVTISAVYNDRNAGMRTLTFTLSGTDRDNYRLAFSENGDVLADTEYSVNGYAYSIADAEIVKRTISIENSASKVFDGKKDIEFDIVSSDIISGDTVTVTGEFDSEHVGTHNITVTVDNNNYTVESYTVVGTISPAPLTVVWKFTDETTPAIYDGVAHGVTVTVSGMIKNYTEAITATVNGVDSAIAADAVYPVSITRIDAGDYSVVLSLGANSDYSLSSTQDSAEWTIGKRTLEITWITDDKADGAYIYDWTGFTVAFSNTARSVTPQVDNKIGADDISLTVSGNSRTNAGSFTAEITGITGTAASNYSLPENKTQQFEIVRAAIEGVTLPSVTYVYNRTPQGVEVSSYTTQHGISINVVYSGGKAKTATTINGANAFINVNATSGAQTAAIDVDKTITASVAQSDNYTALSLDATVTIIPCEITSITLTSKTVTYNATDHSISVNTDVTRYGDKVTVTYTINGEDGNSAKNAGRYTVIATVAEDDDNYVTLTREATLTILKADIDENRITVNADSGTIIYNTQSHGITITVEGNKTQYGDEVTITYYGGENNSGQATNVGTYQINAVVSAGDNYNDYTTTTSTLTIAQKDIRLTLSDADRKFTYDGNTHTATVTFEYGAKTDTDLKVYDGDAMTIKLTYLGTSGVAQNNTVLKNSGKYTVSAELSNKNYRAVTDSAQITIEKATVSGYYFVSNTFTYNKSVRKLGINTAELPLNDLIYTVNLLATDKATVEYTYTTVENGEYDKAFTGAVNAGVYYLKATITADGDASGNYETWERRATLTITPAPLTGFTMTDVTATYDGLAHFITVSTSDKQFVDGVYYTAYGDKVNVNYTIYDGKTDETDGNSAVNVNLIGGVVAAYTVTAHFSFESDVASNYRTDGLDISANLTITPVTLRGISLIGENAVYDGTEHNATLGLSTSGEYPKYVLNADGTKLTVYLAEGHSGDVFNVTVSIEDFDGKAIDAGSYDFVAHIAPDGEFGGNYTAISDLRKTITISRAQAADKNGIIYSQNTQENPNGNLFFKDEKTEYCGQTHYIVLSDSDSGAGLSQNAADVLKNILLYPSTNTAVSDETNIVYTCNGAEFEGAKDFGTYVVTATVSHKNYLPFTLTATITITKATVDYYFVGAEMTYDMATHFAAVNKENAYLDKGNITSITLKGTDTATVSYTYKLDGTDMGRFGGALYVGNYEITATIAIIGDAANNYEKWGTDNSMTVSLIINPYETELIWEGLDRNYTFNGNVLGPITAHFTAADGTTNVEVTVSFEGISGKATGDTVLKNAGMYKLTASHARMDNYTFTTPTVVELTVKKAVIERYLVSTTVPYAAKAYFLVLNRANAASVVEADEYTDKITVFGETITIKYTYTKSGANSKDGYMNDDGVYTELEYGARNAGTYTVTANLDLGEGESNFESWESEKSATLTISRLNLTATSADNFVKTYDGNDDVIDCVISGVINNADHISYVAKYSDENAGEGKAIIITAITHDDYEYLKDNYAIPTIANGEILQRKLVLTDSQISMEFWNKQYDGLTATLHNPLTLTAENSFIEGDDLTLSSNFNSKNIKEANKVLFTLAGKDKDNYTIDNLDFTNQIDFEAQVYLIEPIITDITWSPSSRTSAYSGSVQTVSAYLSVLGVDVANGQLNLTVTLKYTKDGNGNELSSPITNAIYKNAGTYVATATLPDGTDENILTNYGINADTMTSKFVITKATVTVNWSGLASTFTYNGTNQSASVNAAVTLRGEDVANYNGVEYLITEFSMGGEEAEFKNAGAYSLVARFAENVREVLSNNYTLADSTRSLTMNKAKISNITFSGNDEWTYTDGKAHYYFVSSVNGKSYIVAIGSDGITVPVVYYEFDADMPIDVRYSGGDSTLADVNGNNGVENVGTGTRTITATVQETDNYESWTGTLTVNVLKGTLTGIVMDSYTVTYDGAPHRLYAHNADTAVVNGEFSQVKAPDGATVTIKYTISVATYSNEDFNEHHTLDDNYAINAGTYLLQATVTCDNYNDLVLPSADGSPVTLQINPYESTVVWAFGNQSEANFTYNAANQSSSVRASILGASTSGSQNHIELSVAISLIDEIEGLDDVLKSMFVIAGNYSMTASFSSADENEYQKLKNNYTLLGNTVNVEMEKYEVQIDWYNNPDYHDNVKSPYDPDNPCIYNAENHGVTAEGIGINGAVMDIITSGVFDAKNAGTYTARVDSIADGNDEITVDGVKYQFAYKLNYTLANATMNWKIAPRPITITAADGNFLSKIYDGSAVFGVNSNYVKSFVTDLTNEKVVNIQVTYTTLNSAYGDKSKFTYFINNVMAVDKEDVFLPITSITADAVNVLASNATVVFGDLIMNGNNYEIASVSDAIIQSNEDVITKRDVVMTLQDLSHVYNGETYSHQFTYAEGITGDAQFYEKYGYTLFVFYNDRNTRMQLFSGNYLTGSVTIGEGVDAGTYGYVINDLKVVDAETNGVENYNITINNLDTAEYTINKRKIGVTYSNLLQSLQSPFSDVGVTLDISNSVLTDLLINGGETALEALTALVQKDGLNITVNNAWKEKTYSTYTRITGGIRYEGETSDTLLTVFLNSENYTVDAPTLQITYLKIENAEEYKFYINNLNDLLHLDTDNYGLNEMRGELLPTYTQTADIDGIVNGSYAIMTSIRNFHGYYIGDNHAISNITVAQISDRDSDDSVYAGFFARITEGYVKDLKFTNIHVYASSGVNSVGGFAGLIGESATVENIDFNGTLYVYVDYDLGGSSNEVTVGGFVGSAWNTSISNVNVAIKMNVVNISSDKLYVGGFAGLIEGGKYENIAVFADVSTTYKTAPTRDSGFGGIAGYAHGEELILNNYRYLSSSVYVNDGTSAILYDKAFGNNVTFETAVGKLYDDFIAANDDLSMLISDNMVRDYLLPSGANGTSANPVEITNFRQISLILAYPYMNFKITRIVRSPINIPTYHRGFYGAIIYENNGGIRSDHHDSTSDTPLTDAIKPNVSNVIVGKKEEH